MTPRFFRSAIEFRRWLDRHYDRESELWVGFYKAASGKGGLTYREALDEALCFGWIDGVRRRFDEQSYLQRFTPRRARSYWSAVNTQRVEALTREGRMHAAGLAAFGRRDTTAAERYSFEREAVALDPAHLRRFRAHPEAWKYFESEAPWYRRVATHWVTSAKREETRLRRLDRLIADSGSGRRIGGLPQRKTGG